MPRRVALLANPHAGSGRTPALVGPAVARLRAGGLQVEPIAALDAGHAADLARTAVADGVDALVVLGGDGAVNLAAQAVVGTDVPLGILPSGTGNDMARALGIPLNPLAAVETVLSGHLRRVDVGRVAGRVFLSVLSSGFDSRVSERANRMTWPRGPARYRLAMLAELRVFRPVPYEIVLDGTRWRTDAMLVAVGNGPMYGGRMRVCPGADLADGLLDVTVVSPLPTAQFLRIFPSVYAGRHVESPAVRTERARTVSLSAPSMSAYGDGEPFGPLPVTAEAVPAALTVLAPPSPG